MFRSLNRNRPCPALTRQLQVMERAVADVPDHQVSLTDPGARAVATNGKGTGMVGYNVQTAVDGRHHLIIAHEVTNVGHHKHQLANMARQAKEEAGANGLTVFADRGYFSGKEVVACEAAGATPIVPKPLTPARTSDGRFGKQDFIYQPEADTYRCPAGEQLIWAIHHRRARANAQPVLVQQLRRLRDEAKFTPSKQRRITRWEHEAVIEAMQRRLDEMPDAMRLRRSIVEHVFGTIKGLDGAEPLPDTEARQRPNRNEPSGPCLPT